MLLDANQRHAAKLFLESFRPGARREGLALIRRNISVPAFLYLNGEMIEISTDGVLPTVELECEGTEWDVSCECRRKKCEHAFAALERLLARQSDPGPPEDRKGKPAKKSAPDSLGELLGAAVGRPLTKAEERLTSALQQLYKLTSNGRPLSKWDLQPILEFDIYKAAYNVPIEAGAQLSPLIFWRQLARYIRKYEGQIPPALLPLTDVEEMQREEARFLRNEEIRSWRQKLAGLAPARASISEPELIDLRLLFTESAARLQVRTGAEGAFLPIKSNAWEKIIHQITDGDAIIAPEALPLFSIFSNFNAYYHDTALAYNDRSARRMVGNLLRLPQLRDRLVNQEGVPFEIAPQRLVWRLAVEADDCYNLRLEAGDGSLPESFIAVLPGSPTLYLTPRAVYEGPRTSGDLGPGPHRIPAPVLESAQGLSLLLRLDVPLPQKLAGKTRTVAMKVALRCRVVRQKYQNGEYLTVQPTAEGSEVKCQEFYGSTGWIEEKAPRAPDGALLLFERTSMNQVSRVLESLKLTWDHYTSTWRTRIGKNFPERFLAWHAALPREFELICDDELASLLRDPVKARIQLHCREVAVDWFDLETTLQVEDTTLTPEELDILLKAKGKMVRLPGKGWRRLEYELTDAEDQSLARLGISPHDFSPESQRLHALQLADRAAESMLAAEQYRKIQDRAAEIKTRVTPDQPASVTATLRPYQLEGYHFLAYLSENRFGGILADDMGLGKTVQTLTWLGWLKAQTSAARSSLVVCPKSVMENWFNEAVRFVPSLRVHVWKTELATGPAATSASGDAPTLAQTAARFDLVVLNYSQLRNFAQDLAAIEFEAVILDEAQYIKNPDSQTAQAARGLRASHRLALSGTPIENRLLDLWSLMQFAMPGILGNRAWFKKCFDSSVDSYARRRLAARVRPFLLRRTKNQVASDLPDRTEEDLICELEGTQKKLYSAEFKRAQQMLLKVKTQKELNEFRFHFLTSLLRLRQICCHPGLVDADLREDESAKLSALLELLDPLVEEGHKVLVFSQFVEMLQMIRQALVERSWAHYYLDGSTEDRGKLVEKFQGHEGSAVFLVSLKAGGFGLNLTAASYVVLYDPWWNPAVENQAIDRTHRIGQTEKVIAYRLLIKDSIEQKIRELQKIKSGLAQDILGDEAFASSLTIEDLRYLFADAPES